MTPRHTSKIVVKWLKDSQVKVPESPSQILDLNPTENLWQEWKQRMQAKRFCEDEQANIPAMCGDKLGKTKKQKKTILLKSTRLKSLDSLEINTQTNDDLFILFFLHQYYLYSFIFL